MTDVVVDLISAGSVSKALAAAGFTKDAKVGRQSRPFEPLARTGGFRARQALPWRVQVWQRQGDEQAREQTYTRMGQALTGLGYQVERDTQPVSAGALLLTRLRPPSAQEWAALDLLAARPLILDAAQLRDAFNSGTKQIPAEVLAALHRSELIEIGKRFPLLRWPESDTHPEYGSLLSLSSASLALLIRRNKARQARGLWALIAPEHRDTDPPPLLAGDTGRNRPEPVEA